MINHGTRPNIPDHRDYDFVKSQRFGAVSTIEFPDSYDTDNHLWCPDQNSFEPHFSNPPLPFGCTDYTQADISADLDGILKNPIELENITHANANGGAQIRDAIQAARKIGWLAWFYNVQAYAPLDFFDAFRLAIFSGFPEKRSVSCGTPWFPSWEKAALAKQAVMPMPTDQELAMVRNDPNSVGWHNHKLIGWKKINGIIYLIDKSWQGTRIGDEGLLYFPREVVNMVMTINGTVGFTATRNRPTSIKTIDLPILQWLLSHLKSLLGLRY